MLQDMRKDNRIQVTRKTFEARIRELVTGQVTLGRIAEAMLSARATLQAEYEKLHKAMLAFVRADAVCRRLMTVPALVLWWRLPSSRRWTIRVEEYETQVGKTGAPTARSSVAGTVELVKP